MARKALSIATVIIVLLASAGCVPISEHNHVKQQFAEQEAYVRAHRGDVEQARRETTRVAMQLRDKELEIDRLKTENTDLAYRLDRARKARPAPAPAPTPKAEPAPEPQPAPAPKETTSLPASSPKPVAPMEGFDINPETRGIVLDQSVLFAPGSATLRSTAKPILQKVAKVLSEGAYAHSLVRVEGHTDATPITKSKAVKDNWELSGMRAREVLNTLEKMGVNSSRLSFAGYSYHKPLVAGSDKASQAKNRRVEIVILEP